MIQTTRAKPSWLRSIGIGIAVSALTAIVMVTLILAVAQTVLTHQTLTMEVTTAIARRLHFIDRSSQTRSNTL